MNIRMCALFFLLSPIIALAGRGDEICHTMVNEGYGGQITTPPITGNVPAIPSDLAICFNGKDYSQATANMTKLTNLPGNSLRVVSSFKIDGFEEFYVSLYNEKTGSSAITRVFINASGNIDAKEEGLVSKKDIPEMDEQGFFSFVIPGDNKTIYFNVIEPTRVRIYGFEQAPGYFYTTAHIKKISDDYGEYAKKNGDIVVSRDVWTKDRGRDSEGLILDKNGNKKCKVDSSQLAWALVATCD